MPKVTIEFDLPEERVEMKVALKGAEYLSALQEYDNFLRGKIKYAP